MAEASNRGDQAANNMVFCRECGKDLHYTAPICPSCGAVQPGGKGLKSKTAAAVLAIFLGGLGIHRFYLGQWWGLFYLLLCWTGIPGLISFVEGIVIAFTDQRKWDLKYNKGIPSGGSGAGTVVAAIVAVIAIIAFIGILAAVAIPAYQDYVNRAKVHEAVSAIDKAAAQVGAYIEAQKAVPQSLQQAGFEQALPAIIGNVAINQRTGEIQVTLTGKPLLEGATFSMVPTLDDSNRVTWQCVSAMAPKLLPAPCRP